MKIMANTEELNFASQYKWHHTIQVSNTGQLSLLPPVGQEMNSSPWAKGWRPSVVVWGGGISVGCALGFFLHNVLYKSTFTYLLTMSPMDGKIMAVVSIVHANQLKMTIRPKFFQDSPEFWGPVPKKIRGHSGRSIVPNSKPCTEFVPI